MSQPPQMPGSMPGDVPFADPIPTAVETFPPPFRRPGSVTALGVMSIIFAIAEVGWALMFGVIVLMYLFVATVTTVASYSHQNEYTGGVYYADGLTDEKTATLTNDLTFLGNLTSKRTAALEALLTKTGRTVVPTMLTANLTEEEILKLVTDHGKTTDGNDFFEFSEGRVEVMDDRATFEPEGTTQVVVVTVAEIKAATQPAVQPAPTPPPVLKPAPKSRESILVFACVMEFLAAAWAILLFVAAISTLRGRRVAGTLLRWWAWIRLPLVILGTIGTALFFGSFPDADRTATAPVDPVDVIGWMILGSIPGVITLVYLIVVLLMARTKSAKEWFSRA